MPSEPTDRATPPCPHFGPCGGCQLQDFTYAAQLAQKANRLRELLEPVGVDMPELAIHASPPLGYRNRIRLTLAEVDGVIRAGYVRGVAEGRPGADPLAFVPITQCPIAAPILWRAAEAFLVLVNASSATWLRNPQQVLDQLELFTTAEETGLQITLYVRAQGKSLPAKISTAFASLCESLRAQVPQLTGAGIAILPLASPDRSRRAEDGRPGAAWGAPGLNYAVGETSYWVPRTAFFQINRYLIPELSELVTEGRSGSLAWDLYAGVGLFSKPLAGGFSQVVGVEAAEVSAGALGATKLPNLRAVQATTLDFLRATVIQRERPDLIVLDPPRSGAGGEICGLLGRIGAPTLVYVSCSPQTLPADLATLTAAGYTVSGLHLFDLFPQTTHLETVAILTR